MVIDAHHHFWKYSEAEYGWIDEAMSVIRRDFLPPDLQKTLSAAGVSGAVSVQARQTVEETRWLLEQAREHAFLKAVVGWVPLVDPAVGECLDRFRAAPGGEKLRGVRHVVQGEPDPAFLDREDFNRGLREVTRRGLTYDLLIFARQLPAALRCVDRHPEQRFVLDHIAKPVVQGAPPREWVLQLRELSRRPNVSVKFSGVVTEVPGWSWTPESLHPYFSEVLSAFGPQRVLFGSDWPVCLVAASYSRWIETVRRFTAELSTNEQAAIWGANAVRDYQIS